MLSYYLCFVIRSISSQGIQYQLTSCHITTNHSTMVCTVPSGVGTDFTTFIALGGQTSNGLTVHGYAPPVITSIASDGGIITITGDSLPTVGNSQISITGDHFGPAEKQTLFSGSILYRASGQKHVKEVQATNCIVEAVGKKINCRTSAGFGKKLEFRMTVGDEQVSKCADVNEIADIAGKMKVCGGNCMIWCDRCVDVSFFNLHPEPGSGGCPSDSLTLSRAEWDPKDGGGTSTPEYMTRGCWKKTSGKPDATTELVVENIISVQVESSDVQQKDVKDTCARIARRKNWWGFSLRGCLPSNGEISCECSPVTRVPKITSYFANGPNSACSENGLGTTVQLDAQSVYELTSFDTTTIHVPGTRQSSVWTLSTLGYASPIIKKVLGANNSPSTGGNIVTIRGENMGPSDSGFVAYARYGNPDSNTVPRPLPYDGINCRVPLDNDQTNIVCTMAPGVGAGHSWRVTLGGDAGMRRRLKSTKALRRLAGDIGVTSLTFDADTRYRSPVIESFSNPTILSESDALSDPTKEYLTSGNEIVEIRGSNLGPPSDPTYYQYSVRATSSWPSSLIKDKNLTEFTASGCVHHIPHKAIRCIVPEGAGANIAWKLFIDGQESVQPTTAYGPPEIFKIYPEKNRGTGSQEVGNSTINAVTGGGDIIHIIGKNFGSNIKYLESMMYGCNGAPEQWNFDITSSCRLVQKHTEFVCTTAPGVGQSLFFTIIVAGQTSKTISTTDSSSGSNSNGKLPTLSYKIPSIISMERNTELSNPNLLDGGVTFGGFGYRLVGTNFGIEVKAKGQILMLHKNVKFLHDSTFPTSSGGGGGGRRDGVFGASTLDVTRVNYQCGNQISIMTDQTITGSGASSLTDCIKKCRDLFSPPFSCRQVEHTSGTSTLPANCKFFSFSTDQVGMPVTPSTTTTTCVTFMDMVVFAIPESAGFDIDSNVIHAPTGTSDGKCVSQSNSAKFDYKPPFISNMKADLTKEVLRNVGDVTKVSLTLRGTGVDDNGIRLNPSPLYPYDLGGSYGSCTMDTTPPTPSCLIKSKVMLYNYNAFLDYPQDQDLTTAFQCTTNRWEHNLIECQKYFDKNTDPRGNLVIYVDWDSPNWWWKDSSSPMNTEWTKYSPEDSKYIETQLYKEKCRESTNCQQKCDCKCQNVDSPDDQSLSVSLPSSSAIVRNFDFTLETDVTVAGSSTQHNRKIKRICGSPSNVKRFAQSSPTILDACISGGTWAKSQSPCTENTISTCGKVGGSCTLDSIPPDTSVISTKTSVKYILPETIETDQSTSKNIYIFFSPNKIRIFSLVKY